MSGYQIFIPNEELDRIGTTYLKRSVLADSSGEAADVRVFAHNAVSAALFAGVPGERGAGALDTVFAHSEREIRPNGARVIFNLREGVPLESARSRLFKVLGRDFRIFPHASSSRSEVGPDPMP